MDNCIHTGGLCKKPMGFYQACYWCDVPPLFGYFWVFDRGWKAEQRFIQPKERRERLAWVDHEIEQLQQKRAALMALPTQEEYNGTINSGRTV